MPTEVRISGVDGLWVLRRMIEHTTQKIQNVGTVSVKEMIEIRDCGIHIGLRHEQVILSMPLLTWFMTFFESYNDHVGKAPNQTRFACDYQNLHKINKITYLAIRWTDDSDRARKTCFDLYLPYFDALVSVPRTSWLDAYVVHNVDHLPSHPITEWLQAIANDSQNVDLGFTACSQHRNPV